MPIKSWQPGHACNCKALTIPFWPGGPADSGASMKCLLCTIAGVTGEGCTDVNDTLIAHFFDIGTWPISSSGTTTEVCEHCQACYLFGYPVDGFRRHHFEMFSWCNPTRYDTGGQCHSAGNWMVYSVNIGGSCTINFGWDRNTWGQDAREALMALRRGETVPFPFISIDGSACAGCSGEGATCEITMIDCGEAPPDPDEIEDCDLIGGCADMPERLFSITDFVDYIDDHVGDVNRFINYTLSNLNRIGGYLCSYDGDANPNFSYSINLGVFQDYDDPGEIILSSTADNGDRSEAYVYRLTFNLSCYDGVVQIDSVYAAWQAFFWEPAEAPPDDGDFSNFGTLIWTATTIDETGSPRPCGFRGDGDTGAIHSLFDYFKDPIDGNSVPADDPFEVFS